VNPVDELGRLASEADADLVLDAAQSAPRMPLDVGDMPVDALCFSGHKLLGPAGTGVMWARKELLEEMPADDLGGGMVGTVSQEGFTTADPPGKFEAGTPDVASAIGLAEAINYLQGIGMKEIETHESKISSRIVGSLRGTDGVHVLAPESDVSAVSFTIDGTHPHDAAQVLDSHGVAVRAGSHCAQPQMEEKGLVGTVRASPYIYNTESDAERLLEAVEEAEAF
jgi:cysteine desulfurase/selenocysteine lyase